MMQWKVYSEKWTVKSEKIDPEQTTRVDFAFI